MRDDNSNIGDSVGNCNAEVVYVSFGNIGDTSVLCRMWSGASRSGHNTEVSGKGVDKNVWN